MTAEERAKRDAKRYGIRFSTDAPQRLVTPMLPASYDVAARDKTGMASRTPEEMARLSQMQRTGVPPERAVATNGWNSGNPMAIAARYGGADATGRITDQTANNQAILDTNSNLLGTARLRAGNSRIVPKAAPAAPAGGIASGNGLVKSDRGGLIGNQIAGLLAREAQQIAPTAGVSDSAMNAQQRWMEEGGSQRTWNKAGVAMGIRPRIDARTRPDARRSTASDKIRQQFGFGEDPMLPY